jgi:hypothetical protein
VFESVIHQWPEGAAAKPGINYRRNWASDSSVLIKVWRFYFYFRRRSPMITTKPRHIFGFDFRNIRETAFDFDTQTFSVGAKRVSWEILRDILEVTEEKPIKLLRVNGELRWDDLSFIESVEDKNV